MHYAQLQGPWRSQVARLHGMQEVAGPNPAGSTMVPLTGLDIGRPRRAGRGRGTVGADLATKQPRRNEHLTWTETRDSLPALGERPGRDHHGNEEDGNPLASGARDTRFGSGVPDREEPGAADLPPIGITARLAAGRQPARTGCTPHSMGCREVWLSRLPWEQEIAGPNPVAPTKGHGHVAQTVERPTENRQDEDSSASVTTMRAWSNGWALGLQPRDASSILAVRSKRR